MGMNMGMNYQKMMKADGEGQEELGEKRINATSGGGAVRRDCQRPARAGRSQNRSSSR